jgi:hypothetical protein
VLIRLSAFMFIASIANFRRLPLVVSVADVVPILSAEPLLGTLNTTTHKLRPSYPVICSLLYSFACCLIQPLRMRKHLPHGTSRRRITSFTRIRNVEPHLPRHGEWTSILRGHSVPSYRN